METTKQAKHLNGDMVTSYEDIGNGTYRFELSTEGDLKVGDWFTDDGVLYYEVDEISSSRAGGTVMYASKREEHNHLQKNSKYINEKYVNGFKGINASYYIITLNNHADLVVGDWFAYDDLFYYKVDEITTYSTGEVQVRATNRKGQHIPNNINAKYIDKKFFTDFEYVNDHHSILSLNDNPNLEVGDWFTCDYEHYYEVVEMKTNSYGLRVKAKFLGYSWE